MPKMRFEDLVALVERLRGPNGCPWDREQTNESLRPMLVEEAYEVIEAVDEGEAAKLAEELGDLLFQIVFYSQIATERGEFDVYDVVGSIYTKMVRRHPHVFGDAEARSAGRVRERWEQIKKEQEGRSGVFHHVPESLPALLYARKVQQRAAAVNFEYPDAAGAFADLQDEVREFEEALAEAGDVQAETEPPAHLFEELGDVLFAAVNVARRVNVDPELALRAMSRRFVERVERAEQAAAAEGKSFGELALDEQDRYFDRAKEEFE
jgi:tetrapyrrole methylase family protein/MazG family protein